MSTKSNQSMHSDDEDENADGVGEGVVVDDDDEAGADQQSSHHSGENHDDDGGDQSQPSADRQSSHHSSQNHDDDGGDQSQPSRSRSHSGRSNRNEHSHDDDDDDGDDQQEAKSTTHPDGDEEEKKSSSEAPPSSEQYEEEPISLEVELTIEERLFRAQRETVRWKEEVHVWMQQVTELRYELAAVKEQNVRERITLQEMQAAVPALELFRRDSLDEMATLKVERDQLLLEAQQRETRMAAVARSCAEQMIRAQEQNDACVAAALRVCKETEEKMQFMHMASQEIAMQRARMQTRLDQEALKRVAAEHAIHVERQFFLEKLAETQSIWEREYLHFRNEIRQRVEELAADKSVSQARTTEVGSLNNALKTRIASLEASLLQEIEKNKAAGYALADTTLRLSSVQVERDRASKQLLLERKCKAETPYESLGALWRAITALQTARQEVDRVRNEYNNVSQQLSVANTERDTAWDALEHLQQEAQDALRMLQEEHRKHTPKLLEASPDMNPGAVAAVRVTQIEEAIAHCNQRLVDLHGALAVAKQDASGATDIVEFASLPLSRARSTIRKVRNDEAQTRTLIQALTDIAWLISIGRRQGSAEIDESVRP